jgi:hypothetical protein
VAHWLRRSYFGSWNRQVVIDNDCVANDSCERTLKSCCGGYLYWLGAVFERS